MEVLGRRISGRGLCRKHGVEIRYRSLTLLGSEYHHGLTEVKDNEGQLEVRHGQLKAQKAVSLELVVCRSGSGKAGRDRWQGMHVTL